LIWWRLRIQRKKRRRSNRRLKNEHGIAEAEEAVVVLEGMAVGAEGEVGAGEGSDEKEERGVGEVKVGEETADPFKFVRGIDER